ncbi:MAG: phytanoyl-CoA dioxygenase family protein [Pirellulales bacterium]|jgi:ectoine hydroxylase-related dioxygenase (phytanoyl-CoA dioxygenase family)
MAETKAHGIDGDNYWLTEEQIATYHRKGYIVLEEVVTESEIATFESVYQAFIAGRVPGMGRDFCDMSGPYDRSFEDFQLVNAVLPRKYQPELVGNIYERRAESIGRQLIGDQITLDYDQFLAKRPKKGGAKFAWHQDLGYWPTGTPDTVTTTCSLALDDADEDNGCLQVVPGSHLETDLRPHRPMLSSDDVDNREDSHVLTAELKPEDQVVFLPVKRGSISVHNERIVHGSGGNQSERWRRTYIVAHRSKQTVDFEREIGFTHSHNDKISWSTHLESLK